MIYRLMSIQRDLHHRPLHPTHYSTPVHKGIEYDFFFFSSRRRHTRFDCDWSSDVCSSDLERSPEIGSHPSCTPNRIMRSRASQKSGVAKPTKTKTVVTLSKVEYWRVAERTDRKSVV